MILIDKYKMANPTNVPWSTAEWRIFALALTFFALFILINTLWETYKYENIVRPPGFFKIPEKRVIMISIREQILLFILKVAHYLLLIGTLLWRYGKQEFRLLKHKIAQ